MLGFEGCDSVELDGNKTQISSFHTTWTHDFSVTLSKYFGLEGNHCNREVRLIPSLFKACGSEVTESLIETYVSTETMLLIFFKNHVIKCWFFGDIFKALLKAQSEVVSSLNAGMLNFLYINTRAK